METCYHQSLAFIFVESTAVADLHINLRLQLSDALPKARFRPHGHFN